MIVETRLASVYNTHVHAEHNVDHRQKISTFQNGSMNRDEMYTYYLCSAKHLCDYDDEDEHNNDDETNKINPTPALPESMSRALMMEVTKTMMFCQPLNPTLLDDVTINTRSTSFVTQFEPAL